MKVLEMALEMTNGEPCAIRVLAATRLDPKATRVPRLANHAWKAAAHEQAEDPEQLDKLT
jgi:hypothetical protein